MPDHSPEVLGDVSYIVVYEAGDFLAFFRQRASNIMAITVIKFFHLFLKNIPEQKHDIKNDLLSRNPLSIIEILSIFSIASF